MKTVSELLTDILTKDKEESRVAARMMRKTVYGSGDSGKYEDIKASITTAPKVYAKIIEEFRQEYFVTAISIIYFLHNEKDSPDFVFPWLFQLLQHNNGNIRMASVRMIEQELGPLTVHLRIKGESYRNASPQVCDAILHTLYMNTRALQNMYWKPAYSKLKYIDDIPSGQYKSVQLILTRMEDMCGEEYMKQLLKTPVA